MKAIILSRVSTIGQDLSQQTDEVLKECHKDGYSDDDIIIIEQKESAVKLDEEHRLSLHELKSTIIQNPGEIGCVYVYEISRIGRRAEVNYSIRNFLQEHRVQLVILKPYIKLFDDNFKINEAANMTFAIFNALAENEGYLRKERTQRGLRKAQAEGRAGTGKVPFGYYIEPKTRMIRINEEEAAIIRKLYNMYASGEYSTLMLAKHFHETGEIPSKVGVKSMCARVCRLLSNAAYIGKFPKSSKCNGDLVRNIYPRIITDELYDKVQSVKKTNFYSVKRSTCHDYYCKGILVDEETKQKFVCRVVVGEYSFSYDDYKTVRHTNIPINLLDSVIWHVTKEYRLNHSPISEKEIVKTAKSTKNTLLKKVETAKKRIADLKEQALRIERRIVSGRIKEVVGDAMLDETESNIIQLESQFVEYMLEIHECDERIKRYSKGITPVSLDSVTDDKERIRIIRDCVRLIEAKRAKNVRPGTTDITITFENNTFLLYRLNSYVHTCFDRLQGKYVEFEYLDRIDYRNKYQNKSKKKKS